MSWLLVIGLLAGCGGGSSAPESPTPPPTPPVLAASFTTIGSVSFPGCDPIEAASRLAGLVNATCPKFALLGQNTGQGCAINIHGTTTAYDNANDQIGTVEWSYPNEVGPSEQFTFSGGPLTISLGGGHTETSFSWSGVACQ